MNDFGTKTKIVLGGDKERGSTRGIAKHGCCGQMLKKNTKGTGGGGRRRNRKGR